MNKNFETPDHASYGFSLAGPLFEGKRFVLDLAEGKAGIVEPLRRSAVSCAPTPPLPAPAEMIQSN
jgi:hypothetical protein